MDSKCFTCAAIESGVGHVALRSHQTQLAALHNPNKIHPVDVTIAPRVCTAFRDANPLEPHRMFLMAQMLLVAQREIIPFVENTYPEYRGKVYAIEKVGSGQEKHLTIHVVGSNTPLF